MRESTICGYRLAVQGGANKPLTTQTTQNSLGNNPRLSAAVASLPCGLCGLWRVWSAEVCGQCCHENWQPHIPPTTARSMPQVVIEEREHVVLPD
jgi:hypothetical protein